MHVPLIIKSPAGSEGLRINEAAGSIDILPTVCSQLGIAIPQHVQGSDLSQLLNGEDDSLGPRYLYCESLLSTRYGTAPFLGMVSDNWKYIHAGEQELYDLSSDPRETKNLFSTQSEQAKLMQDKLRLILQNNKLSDITDSKMEIDEQTRQRLASLGYVDSSPVDENIEFDQKALDAKKFVEIHNFSEKLHLLLAAQKYSKARKLCQKMVAKFPDTKRLYYELGAIAMRENDANEMVINFSKYLKLLNAKPKLSDMQIRSDYASIYSKLGYAFTRKGEFEQAIEYYKKSLSYNSWQAGVNCNLATVSLIQKMLKDAVKYSVKALEINPDMPVAHRVLAEALLRQGKFEKAILHYNKSLQLKSDQPKANKGLEIALKLKNQNTQKILSWQQSLQKDPNQPALQKNLAVAFYNNGYFDKAISHWELALALKPDSPDVLNALAWVKSAIKDSDSHDPAEAVKLALRACEVTDFKQAALLDTLAISYAAAGDFDKAIETVRKALSLAQQMMHKVLIAELTDHLELFEAGHTYYEPQLTEISAK